ncbi:MAG: peptide chain release factor 1 [Planctomycetota bacterium]|jgi:peptide chain release factor 1
MEFPEALVGKLRERAQRFDELTTLLSDPEVSSDPKRFPGILRERGSLEDSAKLYTRLLELEARLEEAAAVIEEAEDDDFVELARGEVEEVEAAASVLEAEMKSALVADPDDHRNQVIVEIRAGTGGDEATLFAGDLFRMYSRFFDSKKWKVEIFDAQRTEVGGFKELVFAVKGSGVWRVLQHESGGHRVQRVPSTETQGRIHTSAATVAVLAEAEEAELDIKDGDLRIDTMRSSGPGGQSVNKTSSAVRITHLPTDTVVVCQDEKSQHKNKAKALRILRSRLLQAEQDRIHEERAAQRKDQVGSGDRSARVRTYTFPQNRVTDHRLGQNFSLEQVIDGRMEALLDALDEREREERLRNL